ncbi:two-partner secretion domain-containing protein [Paraburkholderia fungorum]|uniref:two-partner secretion domain-containing protein n=1 Tax=Paraburkholderia fungorum TaxID=134537 RepID=UPI000DB14FFA|nr:filamentous hemagglutinin N-terminal domain-containing protein [Paraburkholderia fungorum]PZR47988.1 MAG: filamentous hemagglutinin [Paraburkholderia fungorum]QLD52174.1 filamentous hemagglutinin [Paraburkholderia fungorum]
MFRSARGRNVGRGKPRPHHQTIRLIVVLLAAAPLGASAAGIVIDGGTATIVSTAANGHQTVNIAPTVAGVSNNTYSSFNVDAAGASLNNVGINARTIVNQVTSTNPSIISGRIDVLGSRANVILANPNGITVNGGSFVNTGRVALTTGHVSFKDTIPVAGIPERDIVLDTSTGTIVVGPQGLASALIGLDLIAKNVQINGPLTNGFTSQTAYVRAVAGNSNVTLNTAVSPNDNSNDWLTLSPSTSAATANSFAIDITAAGSLTSGRVQLIVTDKGPGVRSAGPMNASLGDFTLSSNGSVQFANTTLTALNNLDLQVQDSVTLSDTKLKANSGSATLTASGAVSLTGSSLLANAGIDMSGGGIALAQDATAQSVVASTTSGVVLTSTGDIANVGSLIQGQQKNTLDSASLGAVTLNATGNILNQSTPTGLLGVVYGAAGDVSVTAGGSLTNQNARILSNQNLTITAGGDVDNVVDHSSGVNGGAPVSYSDRSWRLIFVEHRDDGFNVDYGALADPDKLSYLSANVGNVTIAAQNVHNIGGTILAQIDPKNPTVGGSISITARDQLLTQAIFTGQASFHRTCFFFCSSSSSSNVQGYGGVIQANNDITLKAGTQITNTGGLVSAEGTLKLDAPRTLAQAVLGYTAINRTHDLKAWFGNAWSAIFAADTGGLFIGGSGQVELTGEADIEGGAFNAPGGIKAAGGVNTISAPYRAPVTIGNHNHLGLVSWFGL